MIATARPAARLLVALGLIACHPPPGSPQGGAGDQDVSAAPWETRPCQGAAAIPPVIDDQLTQLEAPVRDHCERHALAGGVQALFVRIMNTVAHDDRGDPIPTCQWEVFRLAPESIRHLGTLSMCRFRIDRGCVTRLDDHALAAPPTCFEPK